MSNTTSAVTLPAAPSVTVDALGLHAPALADWLAYLTAVYQAIYGTDIYLGNDSQDGQLIGVFAQALQDTVASLVAVYNSFSPTTAQGAGLSSVVKVNGITREGATYSTVDLILDLAVGVTLTNAQVRDPAGNVWQLPASVVGGPGPTVVATATCLTAGPVAAGANTAWTPVTAVFGWTGVANPAAASAGSPIETDAALRRRQAASTALPSRTVLDGIVGALLALPGVTQVAAYQNDTKTADANGLPPNSITLVVAGGDAAAIAQVIATRKSPGVLANGTTVIPVADAQGVPHNIGFYVPTVVPVAVVLTINPLANYNSATGQQLVAAVVNQGNEITIGNQVLYTRFFVPANLFNPDAAITYDVTGIQMSRGGAPLAAANVPMAFNEVPLFAVATTTLTVL